jgi:glycosyltransferase involved in cell wall biosynthesis
VTQRPTVAVIIPCYNHASFLREAIDSVLAQTHPASEIIVVDDGSSDDPASVVENYHDVRFIRQQNQGLSAARNIGLMAAESEKIIFLDADDRLLPEAIRSGLGCFAGSPNAGFVYGGHRRVTKDGRPSSPELSQQAVGFDDGSHQLAPLHRDYDSLVGFGQARASFWRARSVENIQLMRALASLRRFSQAAISETRRSRSPMRRSRHWPRSTLISISTMLSQLAGFEV